MIRRRLTTVMILAVALVIAGVIVAIRGVPADEAAILLSVTLVASVVATVIGAMTLRYFRGRPVRVQSMIVALSSVLVMVAGVVAAAIAMFISTHDFVVLIIVLVVATAVAVGAAFQLGEDIDTGTRQVGDFARTMMGGDDDGAAEPTPEVTGPGELGVLATELADLSRRLDESRSRERALEASRRELIAWVSHDLRAPLATIRAMAEALDDDVADDVLTVSRYHRQIRSDAERLTALVEDLFELSRINSGALRLTPEKVWLGDAIADALTGAYAAAEVKGVEIVERLGELPAIGVSAREFCRALDNLLDNAIRHTPAGGKVMVEAGAVGGVATLNVADECGGIPEADLPRVFDIAFRGDESRMRDERGGGLGLAIARGLVEAHAGSVSVTNHDHGCRFTVRLPGDLEERDQVVDDEILGNESAHRGP